MVHHVEDATTVRKGGKFHTHETSYGSRLGGGTFGYAKYVLCFAGPVQANRINVA